MKLVFLVSAAFAKFGIKEIQFFMLKSLRLIDSIGQNPVKSEYNFEESDSYDGRFWTSWSEFYGCPSSDEHFYGANAFERFCTISNNYAARATRYKECTLPDGDNFDGDVLGKW